VTKTVPLIQSTFVKWLIPILGLTSVTILWFTDTITSDNLLYSIDWKHPIPVLETKWLYLGLHAFTVVPVLLLSFDRRVAYYKSWKPLLPAILIVGSLFILWDVYFTHQGVWGFNDDYISGYKFLLLPIEECLFFLTVPFACIFIYECLNHYIKKDLLAPLDKYISPILILLFLLIGILHWGHIYTCTTFLLAASFLCYHYIGIKNTYRSRFYLAYLVSLIPFFLVNGVLTGGYTQNPVVIYNPEEYLGIRITSVPLDDSIYSFLLLLMITTLYEYFKK